MKLVPILAVWSACWAFQKQAGAVFSAKPFGNTRSIFPQWLRSDSILRYHRAARNVNLIMTATYWEIEQRGEYRADYGDQLIDRHAGDLTQQFGRGFARANLRQMRAWEPVFLLEFDDLDKELDSQQGLCPEVVN